ncbi:hypothetical protein BJ684DRAFT_19787 [Piptocephalis cylindrospora]|uniref:DUF962 domain protein n=1 Tax=Piptocephalis cylindrospora TaxID=1907219 RepID=A0A4P9Y7A1_9FUNG|nr:hypothetical protein BJ684DRAFT_19787 [Piptocephalis cylindrospora]|eukprot:RKP13750.1 hypothetical protein BJ684DRAFT_19787 [Piptocephalis cylindrospora]
MSFKSTGFLEDQLVHFRVHRASRRQTRLTHILAVPMAMGSTFSVLSILSGTNYAGLGLVSGLSLLYLPLDPFIGAATSGALLATHAIATSWIATTTSPLTTALTMYGVAWSLLLWGQRTFESRRTSTFGNTFFNLLLAPFLTVSEFFWPCGYRRDLRRRVDIRSAPIITRMRREDAYEDMLKASPKLCLATPAGIASPTLKP